MSLIGVLTKSKQESYLKQKLEKVIPKEQIFFLKESSLENLKNIKFQTVLIGEKVIKSKKQVRQMVKSAQYVIFNTDIQENLDLLEDLSFKLITYGFNSKATITTSSIEENKIMVCIQRNIQNVQGKVVEPQELKLELEHNENTYSAMELIGLKLLYK